MIHACSPCPKFWVEVISSTTHIQNWVLNKALKGMTPFEAWCGRKPVVRHFKVFGCLAWTCIPPKKRKALEPQSTTCIFFGYPKGVKPYRILDLETHELFIERIFHFKESSPSLASNPPLPSSIVESVDSDSNGDSPSTPTCRIIPSQGPLAVEEPCPSSPTRPPWVR